MLFSQHEMEGYQLALGISIDAALSGVSEVFETVRPNGPPEELQPQPR